MSITLGHVPFPGRSTRKYWIPIRPDVTHDSRDKLAYRSVALAYPHGQQKIPLISICLLFTTADTCMEGPDLGDTTCVNLVVLVPPEPGLSIPIFGVFIRA